MIRPEWLIRVGQNILSMVVYSGSETSSRFESWEDAMTIIF
jgi:hypothetical protein